MSLWTTAACVFLIIVLPVFAGDTCNMDIIKLEENVELIKEQAKIIAEYKATMEALNKTIQDQEQDCKNDIVVLNRTMQQQGEKCKSTTEALNRTIQDQAVEMNQVKADVHKVNKSLGKFGCSTQGRQWLRSFEVCLNLCMDTEGENVGFIQANVCWYLESSFVIFLDNNKTRNVLAAGEKMCDELLQKLLPSTL